MRDRRLLQLPVTLIQRLSGTVVNFFSNSGSGDASGGRGRVIHVTDIVLSGNRPRTAVLQFENRQIINEIFSGMDDGCSILIANQRVQVRKLRKLLDLEWEELLLSFQEETGEVVSQQVPSKTSEKNLKTNAEKEGSICTLVQFRSILEEMEIPDEEFDLAHDVAREIWHVLGGSLPHFRVAMYRHNFLQLRNNFESSVYLLFMYIPDTFNPGGYRSIPLQLRRYILEGENRPLDSILHNYTATSIKSTGVIQLSHSYLEHQLQLSSYPRSIAELQLSRLTTYYCLFDTRLKPLFSLLFFWAKVNTITLTDNIPSAQAFRFAPDPVTLEWILLFFLYHRQNLIPPPQEILIRPHTCIWLKVDRPEMDDLGFNFDENFAEEWTLEKKTPPLSEGSPQFLLSVLELLQKFFHFYGEELTTPCVLSSHEGKIFSLENSPSDFERHNSDPFTTLIVTHPIVHRWRLAVKNKKWEESARPAMKATAGKLGAYVESLKSWIFPGKRSPFLSSPRSALNVTNSD